MKYTPLQLANSLKYALELGYSCEQIAEMATTIMVTETADFSGYISSELTRLMTLNMGDEFLMTRSELYELVQKLESASEEQ